MTRKEMTDSIFYPVECPWPSEEATGIAAAAIKEFEELNATGKHDYIAMVVSHHWASQGYWIEFKPKTEGSEGTVLKEYKKERNK